MASPDDPATDGTLDRGEVTVLYRPVVDAEDVRDLVNVRSLVLRLDSAADPPALLDEVGAELVLIDDVA